MDGGRPQQDPGHVHTFVSALRRSLHQPFGSEIWTKDRSPHVPSAWTHVLIQALSVLPPFAFILPINNRQETSAVLKAADGGQDGTGQGDVLQTCPRWERLIKAPSRRISSSLLLWLLFTVETDGQAETSWRTGQDSPLDASSSSNGSARKRVIAKLSAAERPK